MDWKDNFVILFVLLTLVALGLAQYSWANAQDEQANTNYWRAVAAERTVENGELWRENADIYRAWFTCISATGPQILEAPLYSVNNTVAII